MRRVALLQCLICCALLVTLIGCAATGPTLAQERLTSCGRLAIVAVPGADADPSYANMIIKNVQQSAPQGLKFLTSMSYPDDISVDTSSVPPTIISGADPSKHDAVAVLVYSYHKTIVDLDMYMIDATSGQSIWHEQFSSKDSDTPDRLAKHGYWAPSAIKKHFYLR